MSGSVPQELMDLLDRLGLAEAGTVRAVEGRVRKLGRDLPQFHSIWVDALQQARLLTAYQAAEINGGRGAGLRLGPYALKSVRSSLGYARRFAARHVESGDQVELIVIEKTPGQQFEDTSAALASLAVRGSELAADGVAALVECGTGEDRIWAAIRYVEGQTAAEHVVRHGRMPPSVVLEIARQMAAALVHLEKAGCAHGDVAATTVLLTAKGRAVLLAPRLRQVVRPDEGFAHTDLGPEYYDSVAPERIESEAPADLVTDLFGCGGLWWHLLTGRACFAGGDALGKLRAILDQDAQDVRDLAPDTPEPLATVIAACLARDRSRRPASAAELASRLGSPTASGRAEVARWANASGGSPPIHAPGSRPRAPMRATWPMAVAVLALMGFIVMLGAIGLPSRSTDGHPNVASQNGPSKPVDSEDQVASQPDPEESQPAPPDLPPQDEPNELVLAGDDPVALDVSRLSDGLHVHSTSGARVTVLVRGSPIVLAKEDLLFSGIDFVWQPSSDAAARSEVAAMLQVEAGQVRFRQCTFQTAAGQAPAAAIRWVFPRERGGLTLPTGKLSLHDCALCRVAVGVDARTAAALTIECDNLLHLGPGPLLRLDHAPPVDEPLGLSLTNVTLRGADALLEILDPETVERPGTISVTARLCVFESRMDGALLAFTGPVAPASLAKAIYWTGEGALVTPQGRIAQWTNGEGRTAELNDAAFSIAGLVRSPVEFAGERGPEIDANIARRWQAPLPTDEAPGIRSGTLPAFAP